MNEISAKNLIGMPVFSINEGEEFGHIKQLIMDPAAKRLLALVICSRGRCRDTRIVSAGKIIGIGSDAVTISEKSAVARAANLPKMIKYMHRPDNILGNKIISENGYNLGKAEGYYLNTADCSISRLDIAAGSKNNIFAGKCRVSGRHILTIGPSAIVLTRQALDEMEQIESPLKVNLQNARQKAEKVAGITLDASRKISRTISEKLNDLSEAKEKQQAAAATEDEDMLEEAPEAIADTAEAEDIPADFLDEIEEIDEPAESDESEAPAPPAALTDAEESSDIAR